MSVKQIDDRTLNFNGNQIVFDKRIKEFIQVKSQDFVHFRVDDYELGDELVGQNIVAYDEAGNFLWRVEVSGLRRPNRDEEIAEYGPDAPAAFFDIYLEEDGSLWGGTPTLEYKIDMETGELLDSVQSW